MYKKCLMNRITRERNEKNWYCHVCHYAIKQSKYSIVGEHLLSDMHQNNISQITENQRIQELQTLFVLRKRQPRTLVRNIITFDSSLYFLYCHPCKCKINGFSSAFAHISHTKHSQNLTNFIEQSKSDSKHEAEKDSYNDTIVNKVPTEKHVTFQESVSIFPSKSSISKSDITVNKNKSDIKHEAEKDSYNDTILNKVSTKKHVTFQKSVSILPSKSSISNSDITYNENSNSYFCNICNMKIIATPNISEHVQGLLHQATEKKLNKSTSSSKLDTIVYKLETNSYHCTICETQIVSTPDVTRHIEGFFHQILLKAKTDNDLKMIDSETEGIPAQVFFKSQAPKTKAIGKKNQDLEHTGKKCQFSEIFYCRPCQSFIINSNVLQCHVLLHLYEKIDWLQNYDLIKFKTRPNNKIELECLLCNSFVCKTSFVQADREFEKHLLTDKHIGRLHLFNHKKSDLITPAMNQQINEIDLGSLKYMPKVDISLELLCNVCEKPVFSNNKIEHKSGKSHNKKLTEAAVKYTNSFKKLKLNSWKNCYVCFICDESFPEISNLLKHFKTPEHQWKVIALNMINKCTYMSIKKKGKTESIQCSSCEVCIFDFKTAIDHMLGKKHDEELKIPFNNLNNQDNVSTGSLDQVMDELQKLSVTTDKNPITLQNSSSSDNSFKKFRVKMKNLQKIKKAGKFEASNEELSQLGFSTESIQIPKLNLNKKDDTLDDLISLDFNNSQIGKLPSLAKTKSPRTPKLNSQRSSFATNVLLNGKQYIKFCINSGPENIYNYDSEKISLLKLGVSLTYPYHSDRVCFPCAQQFPDDLQSLFEHLQDHKHLKNICELQIDDKEFEDYPDQFSHLRLAKLYMHVLDQGVQCHACNIQIGDEDEIIRKHAEDLVHKEKSKLWREQSEQLFNQYLTIYKDIWYYAEVFFCEICKLRCEFEMDFVKHLTNPEHMKKIYDSKCRGEALTFDLCPSCITYWFGKTNSYEIHCKSKFHKRFAKNKDFMVPNLNVTASEFLDKIDKNVDLLESESNKLKISEERDKEAALLNAIIETVKPVYPDAKAYIFGSRLSYLGFLDSDVDVFLDCENTYCTSSTQDQSQEYIKSVKSYFESTPNIWVVDEVLLASRIPIMKLRHLLTNLKCDISFSNGLSVEKSKLLGLYNAASPICRKLILFMKKWLTLCRLFGPDCITTFAISWCVIFYLQLQGILPSVYELINLKNESKIISGWQCGFVETLTAEDSNLSFKEHLKGFYTYFANFDFQKSVICPYLGIPIDKNSFTYESTELATEMDVYKKRLNSKDVEIFRFDSPMCIQDPIDLTQNMTKAVKKQQLRCFRQYCILSAEKC